MKRLNRDYLEEELEAIGFPDELVQEFGCQFFARAASKYGLLFDFTFQGLLLKGEISLDVVGPDKWFIIVHYSLQIKGSSTVKFQENIFQCNPWSITLDEAVNLMAGRYVHRDPDMDSMKEGYWMWLDEQCELPGVHLLRYVRNNFDVESYLRETGLGGDTSMRNWDNLNYELEGGGVCDMEVRTEGGIQCLKVEADPLRFRLLLKDEKGKEIGLAQVLDRKPFL